MKPESRVGLAFAICVLTCGINAFAAEELTKPFAVDLFVAGAEGYHTYRIPSLIVTKAGTLLAFCEGRKTSSSDHGDLDLVLRRSTDGGRTWSPMQLVHEEGGTEKITIGNPCPVIDQSSGRIWLPFNRNNDDVLITYSDDDGRTWAKPRDITSQVKQPEWGWFATGPGVGIQLQHGKHAGRLVIPFDVNPKIVDERHTVSCTFYSDDHGETWHTGQFAPSYSNECQVAELHDGTLLMNARNDAPMSDAANPASHTRVVRHSTDGGETWDKLAHDPALVEPVCQGSLVRYDDRGPGKQTRLLFSNPASSDRNHMTVRLSEDDGRTWPVSRELYAGPAAYSCLTVLTDGTIGCLYEAGEKGPYERLQFVRFPLTWLRGK